MSRVTLKIAVALSTVAAALGGLTTIGCYRPDFSVEDLTDYEQALLAPFLTKSTELNPEEKLVMMKLPHPLEVTPPVVVVVPEVWNRGELPEVHEHQSALDPAHRASSVEDAKTVVFYRRYRGIYAFDAETGGYRGAGKAGDFRKNQAREAIAEAVSRDRGWSFRFTRDALRRHERRGATRVKGALQASDVFRPPFLVFVRYGGSNRPQLRLLDNDLQAQSSEDLKTLVHIDFRNIYGLAGRPGPDGWGPAGRIQQGRFHAFDGATGRYLGSCSKRSGKLSTQGRSSGTPNLNINETLRAFSRSPCELTN